MPKLKNAKLTKEEKLKAAKKAERMAAKAAKAKKAGKDGKRGPGRPPKAEGKRGPGRPRKGEERVKKNAAKPAKAAKVKNLKARSPSIDGTWRVTTFGDVLKTYNAVGFKSEGGLAFIKHQVGKHVIEVVVPMADVVSKSGKQVTVGGIAIVGEHFATDYNYTEGGFLVLDTEDGQVVINPSKVRVSMERIAGEAEAEDDGEEAPAKGKKKKPVKEELEDGDLDGADDDEEEEDGDSEDGDEDDEEGDDDSDSDDDGDDDGDDDSDEDGDDEDDEGDDDSDSDEEDGDDEDDDTDDDDGGEWKL